MPVIHKRGTSRLDHPDALACRFRPCDSC